MISKTRSSVLANQNINKRLSERMFVGLLAYLYDALLILNFFIPNSHYVRSTLCR